MPYRHAQKYQEIEIKTASPTELVVLMYDKTMAAIQKAQKCHAAGDIGGRVRNLNQAYSILTELQANLNFDAGGPLADSLDRLYHYLKDRIFQANLRQDDELMGECVRLLANLRSAWAEVARSTSGKDAPADASYGLSLPNSLPEGHLLAKLNLTA